MTQETDTQQQIPTLVVPQSASVAPAIYPPARRQKGELERQVRSVIDDYVTGVLDAGDKPITAYRVATVVVARYPEQTRPSAGAVSAVFARWTEIGAAVMENSPLQFVGYTTDASELGFRELTRLHKQGKG